MKFVVPFQKEIALPNALLVRAFVTSGVDFFRQRPSLLWTFLLLCVSTTYIMSKRSSEVINIFEEGTIEKYYITENINKDELGDLETFYLEELLYLENNNKSREVLTKPNIYLDESFYHFDKVKKSYHRKADTVLRKIKKEVMEKKLIASLPEIFRTNAQSYIRPILLISEKYQLDPFWLTSIMWTESHFKFHAKSHVGASGLMQIMPDTRSYLLKMTRVKGLRLEAFKGWNHLAKFNPKIKTWKDYKKFKAVVLNIELGAFYLKQLLNAFHSHTYATVAYNMGPGWTRSRLRKRMPIGNKNDYLNKVNRAYHFILKRIPKV